MDCIVTAVRFRYGSAENAAATDRHPRLVTICWGDHPGQSFLRHGNPWVGNYQTEFGIMAGDLYRSDPIYKTLTHWSYSAIQNTWLPHDKAEIGGDF